MINRKIALPIKDSKLSPDFRNCSGFEIYLIENSIITKKNVISLPLGQPDLLPILIAKIGVTDVIVADIRIIDIKILARHKINVFTVVEAKDTRILVEEFLDGILETKGNLGDQ